MTKPNSQKPIDWAGIERDYHDGVLGVREIARRNGISDTAIHKKAKAGGWVRKPKPKSLSEERREQRSQTVEITQPASAKPEALSDRARGIAGRLMDELETVTAHVGELEDMICAEESDPRRRQALLKAVSLSERSTILKNLTASLKTVGETAESGKSGKKAARQARAESAAGGGNKFAAPSAPKLVVDNRR